MGIGLFFFKSFLRHALVEAPVRGVDLLGERADHLPEGTHIQDKRIQ